MTLTVDLARSDLLLETELPRFAELSSGSAATGQRQYRLTPASLAAARGTAGCSCGTLEAWFQQRTRPAAVAGGANAAHRSQLPPPRVAASIWCCTWPAPEMADGLLQWPQTRGLIAAGWGQRRWW